MISPLRKPGRYGLSGRGCLPGHLFRAHCGGNSSNSLSKDLDRVRRHWQGPCWVAVVVVDAEVWELKLPRSIMPLWEGCPAVDGLWGCCRCARARVRSSYAPSAGRATRAALREAFGVGLWPAPAGGLSGSESCCELAGAEDLSGRGVWFGWSSRPPSQHHERGRRPRRPRCYG